MTYPISNTAVRQGPPLNPRLALDEIQRIKAIRDFEYFVKLAWPHVDPSPLVWNWHMSAICLHLQAVIEGKIRRLLINVPPGSAKSKLTVVYWPAWVWTFRPEWSSLVATYAEDLAKNHLLDLRHLLQSDWYRETFRIPWEFQDDRNTSLCFANTKMGKIVGFGIGGIGTGYRGNNILVDDSLKAADADSISAKAACEQWWTSTMKTRRNDPKRDTTVGISQRIAADDWSAYRLLERTYEHLRIPMLYEVHPNCECPTCTRGHTSIGWRDPRKEEGALLFPERWGTEEVDELKKDPIIFSSQQQQDPVANAAGTVEFEHFRNVWVRPGEPHLPTILHVREVHTPWQIQLIEQPPAENTRYWQWDTQLIVLDATFKDTKKADKVALGVFGKKGALVYLLHLFWDRADIVKTMLELEKASLLFPLASAKLVEEAANGYGVISMLQSKLPGILPVQARSSKESRFQAVVPFLKAYNLVLPLHAPWRTQFIQELVGFPRMPNDDAVDLVSMALAHLLIERKDGTEIMDKLISAPF